MKTKIYLITLFSLLLVFPTNAVLAFENSSKTPKTENHICANQGAHSQKKSCSDKDCTGNKGCGGSCNNKHCHFPSSVSTPFYVKDAEQINIPFMYVLKVDQTYVQNTPKKISLSIWQPPEIS